MHIQFTENGPYWPTENTKFTPSCAAYNDIHPEIVIEYNGKQYWETLHQFKFAMAADAKKKANEIIREAMIKGLWSEKPRIPDQPSGSD